MFGMTNVFHKYITLNSEIHRFIIPEIFIYSDTTHSTCNAKLNFSSNTKIINTVNTLQGRFVNRVIEINYSSPAIERHNIPLLDIKVKVMLRRSGYN